MPASRPLALALLAVLAACGRDPMSASDGIFPTAGSAPRTNVMLQKAHPQPSFGIPSEPGSSGVRAAAVIDAYHSGAALEAPVSGSTDTTAATPPAE